MGHNCLVIGLGVSVMVFAAFNNISVISWWRKTKKNTDLPLVTGKLYYISMSGIQTHNASGDGHRLHK